MRESRFRRVQKPQTPTLHTPWDPLGQRYDLRRTSFKTWLRWFRQLADQCQWDASEGFETTCSYRRFQRQAKRY